MGTRPTSNWSWRRTLNALLSSLLKTDPAKRVALVGVGSELRGDDAAGLFAAHRLNDELAGKTDILAYEAGQVPENALGPLRRFSPALVIIIDAAQMGEPSGTIRWVSRDEIDGFSASTHTFPLSFIMDYFATELSCPVRLLAIQPEQMDFDRDLSSAVRQAVDEVVEGIAAALS